MTDEFLIDALEAWVATGLESGDGCLVFTTPGHRVQLETRLKAVGIDLEGAGDHGRYLWLDAGETLAKLLVNHWPEAERFAHLIGDAVERAGTGRRHVRVFGEMVALLWSEGRQAAAIRLEELWNQLLQVRPTPFTLFCVYAMPGCGGTANSEAFAAICEQHSMVFPDERYASLVNPDERLRVIADLQQRAASLETEIMARRQMEERLRAANRRLDEFLGVASHELRTPLTSAKVNVQLALRHLDRLIERSNEVIEPAELHAPLAHLRDLFARTERQLERQRRLVDDILDLSRIQEGKLELRMAPCDLNQIVLDAVVEQRLLNPERSIIVRLPERRRRLLVVGDADRIGQVVTNYLTNALKYSREEQCIAVGMEVQGSDARVAVRDAGPGLAPQDQGPIWERFHRASGVDVQSGSGIGLGLGLYICKSIIEQHNGQVGVESTLGEGSTFWLTLPLQRNASRRPAGNTFVSQR
jgi:signal transduction histidine kinase